MFILYFLLLHKGCCNIEYCNFELWRVGTQLNLFLPSNSIIIIFLCFSSSIIPVKIKYDKVFLTKRKQKLHNCTFVVLPSFLPMFLHNHNMINLFCSYQARTIYLSTVLQKEDSSYFSKWLFVVFSSTFVHQTVNSHLIYHCEILSAGHVHNLLMY